MPDQNSVVERAMQESADAFVRGVRCFNPERPDVTIPDKLFTWFHGNEQARNRLTKLLGDNPEQQWNEDGPKVCRAAFSAGALASLHAYAKPGLGPKSLALEDVMAALDHVGGICDAGVGIRYVYCRIWA